MHRRTFLHMLGLGALVLTTGGVVERGTGGMIPVNAAASHENIRLFLCGDVMTGRGIDQILPHPSHPRIHEGYLKSAGDYVEIAEQANGPIPRPVSFDYIWGDVLTEFQQLNPDLRIINLETAVTTSDAYWPGKGINYRMHPKNMPCLTAARIDACVLANNHVLDWGYDGLLETLKSLEAAGIRSAGAGRESVQAEAPAIFDLPGKGRLLLFAFAHRSSGVPGKWQAEPRQPGVALLEALSEDEAARMAYRISVAKRPGDLVMVSIHWGGNWGYQIPSEQRQFAHWLIDRAGVDIVHGHSSHHPKAIEIYRERPIFYGCGDFLNDYEGISGYETFRDDLTLMYFVTMEPRSGRLLSLTMTPLQIRQFRLHYPTEQDQNWLQQTMDRECAPLGTGVTKLMHGRFELDIRS